MEGEIEDLTYLKVIQELFLINILDLSFKYNSFQLATKTIINVNIWLVSNL